jgi:hypothetical protein
MGGSHDSMMLVELVVLLFSRSGAEVTKKSSFLAEGPI